MKRPKSGFRKNYLATFVPEWLFLEEKQDVCERKKCILSPRMELKMNVKGQFRATSFSRVSCFSWDLGVNINE